MKHLSIFERREHRAILLYCVVQCWYRGWDGIRINREQLERLLGLQRFKQGRLEWMKEDFGEMFQHQRSNSGHWLSQSFSWIELSRRAFEENPRIGALELWEPPDQISAEEFPDELRLASYLSLLAQGRISPQWVPPANGEI
ncbi:MAG: hypothetical protein NTZ17_14535 [Phycisphaerae bacterium]|nr:hypothetical protein [Phycisphaerae bacterium]